MRRGGPPGVHDEPIQAPSLGVSKNKGETPKMNGMIWGVLTHCFWKHPNSKELTIGN